MTNTRFSSLSNLELMRRIAVNMAKTTPERVELEEVIRGLSMVDVFEVRDGKVSSEKNRIPPGRKLLSELLPGLKQILPADKCVEELARRYVTHGTPR